MSESENKISLFRNKKMHNFFLVGFFVLQAFMNAYFSYLYYLNNQSMLSLWAFITTLWILLCFMLWAMLSHSHFIINRLCDHIIAGHIRAEGLRLELEELKSKTPETTN